MHPEMESSGEGRQPAQESSPFGPHWALGPSSEQGPGRRNFPTGSAFMRKEGAWTRGKFHLGLESPGMFFDLTTRPTRASGELCESLTWTEWLLAQEAAKCQGNRSCGQWPSLSLNPLRACAGHHPTLVLFSRVR